MNASPIDVLHIQHSVTPSELTTYLSATQFEHFISNDQVCDWLSIVLPKKPQHHPLQSLFNKGIHFEATVLSTLRLQFKLSLPKLSSLTTSREYTPYEHRLDLQSTITAMKRGDPLLYSAYMASEKEELRGIPDLLVRSDYIERYFGITDVPQEPSSFGDYYYIPIEIKYSSLSFDKTEKTLLNVHRTKLYKTQLCVYAKILSDLQGVFPCCAFIIGKFSPGIQKTGPFTFPLGHVYFNTRDSDIRTLFYTGLEWLREVHKHAFNRQWVQDHLTVLLPNMKNHQPLYEKEKQLLCDHYGDVTEFWQCSVRHRVNLLDTTNQTIYSWKHPDFCVDMLHVPAGYIKKIDALFEINKEKNRSILQPKHITHDLYEWRTGPPSSSEWFIDFETTGNANEDEESTIYLIGIGQLKKSFSYTYFMADSVSPGGEKNLLLSFYKYWKDNGSPRLWHWYADESFWNRACKKYDLDLTLTWLDLHKVFFEGEVMVKGCKNFKLKSYIYALTQHKLINITLPPDDCCNGMDALSLGEEYYEKKNKDILEMILLYNKFDCEALYVLLDMIRKKL